MSADIDEMMNMTDEEFLAAPAPVISAEDAQEEPQEEETHENAPEELSEVPTDEEETADEAEEESEEESDEEADVSEEDLKAFYKEITSPFKANGTQLQAKSKEDVIQLMQMGANYSKKMSAMKENARYIKMLEDNGLLDEAKLNYLIDLDKQDPGAVKKLVKESGVEVNPYDEEESLEYSPKNYSVSNQDVELKEVLDSIKDTEHYSKTIDILGNQWDEESKLILQQKPHIIEFIHEQVSNGQYDKVAEMVEREKMFGRLKGLSDLEAYDTVGRAMFSNPGNDSGTREVAQPSSNNMDSNLSNRKKAASVGKKTKPVAKKKLGNPNELSDDEFLKVMSNITL